MRRVHMEYHQDGDTWWAESPDAPGFTAVGQTEAEVRLLAREGVAFFLDEEVLVEDGSAVLAVTAGGWVDVPFFDNTDGPLRRRFPLVRDLRQA